MTTVQLMTRRLEQLEAGAVLALAKCKLKYYSSSFC